MRSTNDCSHKSNGSAANKPLQRGFPPFENLTEQTADYLVFCALGTLITVEKPEPPKDLATMFSNTLQAEAVDAFRPSDELTANFSALYTHWLDWFIHRNGAEAGEKYNFFPPITMTAEQKRQWTQWTMYNWDEFESEKTKAMRSAFDALIKDNSQPHLMAAIRGAQQKQQQRLRLIRNSF